MKNYFIVLQLICEFVQSGVFDIKIKPCEIQHIIDGNVKSTTEACSLRFKNVYAYWVQSFLQTKKTILHSTQ